MIRLTPFGQGLVVPARKAAAQPPAFQAGRPQRDEVRFGFFCPPPNSVYCDVRLKIRSSQDGFTMGRTVQSLLGMDAPAALVPLHNQESLDQAYAKLKLPKRFKPEVDFEHEAALLIAQERNGVTTDLPVQILGYNTQEDRLDAKLEPNKPSGQEFGTAWKLCVVENQKEDKESGEVSKLFTESATPQAIIG